MKLRKILSLVLSLILALSVLAGCGDSGSNSGSAASGDTVNVDFWTLTTRTDALEPIVAAFNAANDDVNVTVAFYDTDGIKNACKVSASSKTLPHMWFNWGGNLGGFYADNGLTYDLTQYADENKWDEKFSASVLNLCTFDDKLSGYPTAYNVLGVYYRTDIFEENNLSVPTTFEEFEEVCAVLKANGITPISTAGLNGWHVMRFVELFIEHYAGAELHDSMNSFEESYDNEAVVKALAKYKEFCDKGYFPNGFITADPNDTRMAIYSGQAAMDIQGQWYDGNIVQDGQDMSNFGVFAFPSGGTNRMSAFAEMVQFNADLTEKELDACMRFLEYYYNEENVSKYSEYYNFPLPTLGAEMPEGQPNVPVLMEASNKNGTFTITDQAFPTEVADALFDVQAAIANDQTTPEEGAAKIQEAIEAYKNS